MDSIPLLTSIIVYHSYIMVFNITISFHYNMFIYIQILNVKNRYIYNEFHNILLHKS